MSRRQQPVSREDVQRQLNVLERLSQHVSSDDDLLIALLENQNLMLQNMTSMMGGSFQGPNSLSANQAGLALKDIDKGDTGRILFEERGTKMVVRAEAGNSIEREEVVYVSETEGPVVLPANDVSEGQLFGIGPGGSRRASQFFIGEPDEPTTLEPGDEKTVYELDVSSVSLWWETGTTSDPDSSYQYIVDGEELFNEPLTSPIGLINDRFRFPQPIQFSDGLKVIVLRDQSAQSNKDYTSRLTYYES
jgi:hypothetical protein